MLAFALVSAGCRQSGAYFGSVDPPEGNVLRFNNGAEPEYLDPGLASEETGIRIDDALFEGLTAYDEKGFEPRPAVAERWEISADRLTYTFHLRKNAAWSDGHPVTAQDFVYSWTRVLDPKTASQYASNLYFLRNGELFNQGKLADATQVGVRALDDHVLEVTLQQPTPFFLHLTAFSTYYPVPEAVVKQHGIHWTDPENIVSNGPFLLREHRTHDRMVLERNPRYWNAQSVRLDRIIAYSIDDNYTSANMYEAGKLDWVPGFFPAEYVTYMRGRFGDLQSRPELSIYYYQFNVTRPPLNNRLVRRALSMAVDRRAITDDLLRGGQIPGAHFVPLGFPNYQSPPGPEFDPQKAAQLLAEAGYPNGRGFPEMELSFNTLEAHRKIAEAIQQMWAKYLNVHVHLHNEEWASFLKARRELNYDIARSGWIADYPDPSAITDLMESTNGNNDTGWKSPEYDGMLAAARREADPERRMRLLEQAEAFLLEELPVLPIYTYAGNHLIKPYLRGIHPSPQHKYLFNQVCIDHAWRMRGAEQDGLCE